MARYRVQYQEVVTRMMIVEADSEAEAREQAEEGNEIKSWEEDSSDFRILDVQEEKVDVVTRKLP